MKRRIKWIPCCVQTSDGRIFADYFSSQAVADAALAEVLRTRVYGQYTVANAWIEHK